MAYNKLKFILDSKKASIQMKIRIFNSFIASIFLYNSELWTLSKKTRTQTWCFPQINAKKITENNMEG